jgi:NAD(P)-dependent dehydrogenase (short-subunit alcohol dehydrogenase family)
MPDLQTIRAGVTSLPTSGPTVVALTGATTGIGSYVARALATTFASHGPNLRVYLVGRNASRAGEILEHGRTTSPGSEWIFLPAGDLALIKDVDAVCAEIARREQEAPFAGGSNARVDVLYMSQALSPMQESKGKSCWSCVWS